MVFPKVKGGSREWERREERKRWETAGRATIGSPSFNSINQIRGKCKAEAKLVPEGEKEKTGQREKRYRSSAHTNSENGSDENYGLIDQSTKANLVPLLRTVRISGKESG